MYRFFKGVAVCFLLMVFMGASQKLTVFAEDTAVEADENINMSGMDEEINIGTSVNEREDAINTLSASDCTGIWLSGTYLYEEAWEILDLVNQERVKAGVPKLTMDKELLSAAMQRAIEIQIDFSHTRPNGESCFTASDKAYGENIAAGNSTAEATMRQWMNSPGHKANILDSRYSSLGVGCFTQGGVRYWVQLFGIDDAVSTNDRQNKNTTESIAVLSDSIKCQMNLGDPYRVERGSKENYDGKFVMLNNGWDAVCTWILPSAVEWSSSDTSIFTVDIQGHVTGVNVGNATLTAKLKAKPDVKDTLGISVYDPYGLTKVKNAKAISYGKNKVLLSWDSSKNAEGYLIYALKDGKYGYVGMTTTGTSFIDKKALDTEYNFYWIFPCVIKGNGDIYAGSASEYVYARGIIPAVQNIRGYSVTGGVRITWSAQPDADGYLIYGRRAGGEYGYVGMTTTGTVFKDAKASKNDFNFYWVFPYHEKNGKMIVGGTSKYVYGKAL